MHRTAPKSVLLPAEKCAEQLAWPHIFFLRTWSTSSCSPSAEHSWNPSVCWDFQKQRWLAKAWDRGVQQLVLFSGLSLPFGWLQINHFSLSYLISKWNIPWGVPWAHKSMRTCLCVWPKLYFFQQWLLHGDIKSLRHSNLLLCLFGFDWPLPFLLFLFLPFFLFFEASLSTWSFPRNIWHDDTGVWQVTSLETQRHEEKSKTLLKISL